jgi:signal transduction histidine kinase
MTWFTLAAVAFAVGFFVSSITYGTRAQDEPGVIVVTQLGLVALPLAAGLAILRYRLYGIDIVVSKTVVYGVLAAFITIVYVAIVVGIGAIAEGVGNAFLSAIAAAVVAIAFQPVRRRAQRLANRVVYGKRATPYEVLTEFSERVGGSFAAEDVLAQMARILGEGTGARGATVWLRLDGEWRRAATWPTDVDAPTAPDDLVEVVHRGEVLGALSVAMPANDPMNPAIEGLVHDLASQAGLVLRNVRLVEELRESRRRIVAAQDEERRRIERNIHDGAQQQLVALAVKQRLAASLVGRDDERARTLLADLGAETNAALDDLRDLARGIFPPLLADEGLGAALAAQARRSAVTTTIDPNGIGRYAPEVEAAVYFSVLEALQNAAKYAQASHATIELSHDSSELTFRVTDDGRGFDPDTVARGTGLQGMIDRLDAIGGSLEIRSEPGRGTTIAGRVPETEPATPAAPSDTIRP